MPICSEPDCDKPAKVRGMCKTHYMRAWRGGSYNQRPKKQCAAPDCSSLAVAKGLCRKHRDRMRKNGSLDLVPRDKQCAVLGCSGKHEARGLCHKHYQRLMTTGSVADPVTVERRCSDPECFNTAVSKGMCHKHYQRQYVPRTIRVCSVSDCTQNARSKGLCWKHAARLRRTGSVDLVPRVSRPRSESAGSAPSAVVGPTDNPLRLGQGPDWTLERQASELLLQDLNDRGDQALADEYSWLTDKQLVSLQFKEVFNKNGIPDPHIVSGMLWRAYNPLIGKRPRRHTEAA